MLFNSYEFILAFLPLTLLVFALSVRYLGREAGLAWLVAASLFFYSWWNPSYLLLILSSMLFNYALGQNLARGGERHSRLRRRLLLGLGVAANLGLLGYYKYANFFVDNLNLATGSGFDLPAIVLPLAISFFTFQQIAYLADAYEGVTAEYNFLHYALFVTFFPQLIAGPIVHHKEMLPQFMADGLLGNRLENIAVGLAIFSLGLFKKAVLADGIAPYANGVFDGATGGAGPSLLWAWGGALAYTMQLYFDFSGYSDMAIGAARMFGIRLPLNFHSPYKAVSIVEFWRRWHMTLSRFLRDYLYIPLGGNRHGRTRRYLNLMTTMVLGGLWHGAGWTFVVWGALHGSYLVINNAWRRMKSSLGLDIGKPGAIRKAGAWLLTFLAVVVGWVFFRAQDLGSAVAILQGMAGIHGVALPNAIGARLGGLGEQLQQWGVMFELGGGSDFVLTWLWVLALSAIALLMPNTQQFMARFNPALQVHAERPGDAIAPAAGWAGRLRFGLGWSGALLVALLSVMGVLSLSEISEFLYFQF